MFIMSPGHFLRSTPGINWERLYQLSIVTIMLCNKIPKKPVAENKKHYFIREPEGL